MEQNVKKTKNVLTRYQRRLIFYVLFLAIPIIQVSVFYIYTHINSIILAFQHYELGAAGQGYVITFAGFENFKNAWDIFVTNFDMVKRSLILYAFRLGLVFPCSLLFSFYIVKKFPGHKLFQVILYMPQLISSVVFASLYRYMVNDVYTEVFNLSIAQGLLNNFDTRFGAILGYNIWIAFGVRVIMFTNAMSGIDTSIVEAAQLDGVTPFQEFYKISVPMIFPTVVSFVIIGLVGVFTDQMSMVIFFKREDGYPFGSLGYYLYVEASFSDVITTGNQVNYSTLSALGVILTCIILPIIVTVRKLLNKFGPSVE